MKTTRLIWIFKWSTQIKRQYCLNCYKIHVYQNHIQMYKVKISNYGYTKVIKKWWSEKYACLKNNTVKKMNTQKFKLCQKEKKPTLYLSWWSNPK